jgi:SAM-dependent methyltransferase
MPSQARVSELLLRQVDERAAELEGDPAMTTDYNTIATEYKRAKQQPWRMHVEHFTLFDLIGDLAGKSVLDLACGEGFYTRFLRRGGAARAVGVDVSEGMIALARAEEARNPLGIDYVVQDARELDLGETFDLVVAGYLLNYASTPDELLAMCRGIARSLRPGGRFVTVNNSPEQPPAYFADCRKYGFVKSLVGDLREGAAVEWRFFLEDGSSFDITNYYLSIATHERALRSAGLHGVRWQPPRLSPAGEAEHGKEFWSALLENSPIIFLECAK